MRGTRLAGASARLGAEARLGGTPFAVATAVLTYTPDGAVGSSRTSKVTMRLSFGFSLPSFQTIVPLQMVGGTGVGDAGADAYARAAGIGREEFLARFGAPLPPRKFGDLVVCVLDEPKYLDGFAFGLKGDTGITLLEGASA